MTKPDDVSSGASVPAPVDIIIPVYRGFASTRECIESVLAASVRRDVHLVVVDDASPEPDLITWLDDLAGAGRFELLRNATNQGFVRSVNRAMALHPERDVILLNSDTRVANDWLDRMAACAERMPQVATVTPFSNNATICSYPFEGWQGDVPGALGLDGLDAVFARTLSGRYAELPTGVGFCMYIRRVALELFGLFDAQAYGRGYGEENDFCMKAARAGWRNLLAADVFVYHEGAVSFSEDRFSLMKHAEGVLLSRFPEYEDLVSAFIAADPLGVLRDEIDHARVQASADEAGYIVEERRQEREILRQRLRDASAHHDRTDTRPVVARWHELFEESASRLKASSRWGPLRRQAVGGMLRGLAALTARAR